MKLDPITEYILEKLLYGDSAFMFQHQKEIEFEDAYNLGGKELYKKHDPIIDRCEMEEGRLHHVGKKLEAKIVEIKCIKLKINYETKVLKLLQQRGMSYCKKEYNEDSKEEKQKQFLCLRALRISIREKIRKIKELSQDIKDLQKKIQQIKTKSNQ